MNQCFATPAYVYVLIPRLKTEFNQYTNRWHQYDVSPAGMFFERAANLPKDLTNEEILRAFNNAREAFSSQSQFQFQFQENNYE